MMQVTDLRLKARLLVPEAATLVGVLDEFGVLAEDEVFAQVGPVASQQLKPVAPGCLVSQQLCVYCFLPRINSGQSLTFC